MPVMNTGLLERGMRNEFGETFEKVPTHWANLATTIKSDADGEKYRWVGAVRQMREWGTGRVATGLNSESYDIQNSKYEITMEIDRDEIDDAQTNMITQRINSMATRAAAHKDRLLANLLMLGAEAESLAFDGKPFFAADHESGNSGAQSNILTSNVTTPAKPTAVEIQESFDEALAALLTFNDDQGEPMSLTDRGLYIVVHPALKLRWLEALKAAFVGSTQNVRDQVDTNIISFPWLTDRTEWFLLKTDEAVRPFIFQDRMPIEFKLVGPGSEEEFKKDKWYAGVRARYAMAYGRWEFAVQTTFN